jgi:CheY-like chemotaxis protein
MERKVILLADDAEDNRVIFSRILTYGGYEVRLAENGAEAVRSALDDRPDLIVLDLAMPVLNGFDTLAELRRMEPLSDVPVAAFSAHNYPVEAVISRGFCMFIRKPVSPRTFLERVRECLSGEVTDGSSPPLPA